MKHPAKLATACLAAAALAATFALGSCAANETATSSSTPASSTTSTQQASTAASSTAAVSNSIASDESALTSTYASAFEQKTYKDSQTGKQITYNLYLPEGYDESKSYPMVVFIADSSCTGSDATRSLTQGLGGVVWASAEWQAAYPSIVCVPTYPETILDDHGSYTTTDYVEMTYRLINAVSDEYAVDTNRIYGTGQSMGCMTTLILASEHPELYAACMLVDGQWDVSTLKGLEGQNFVYFAAEDDQSANAGMQEVMQMYDADGQAYTYKQWDGNWSADELSSAASELFEGATDRKSVV